jgi:hypothetical protein
MSCEKMILIETRAHINKTRHGNLEVEKLFHTMLTCG